MAGPASSHVDAGSDGEEGGKHADEQEADTAGHDTNNDRFDHVGHDAQGNVQFAFVSFGQIAQGAGNIAGFFADFDQIDHQLRKDFAARQGFGDGLSVRHLLAGFGNGLFNDAIGDDLLGDLQGLQHGHAVVQQSGQSAG